jgi:hypothetical protein
VDDSAASAAYAGAAGTAAATSTDGTTQTITPSAAAKSKEAEAEAEHAGAHSATAPPPVYAEAPTGSHFCRHLSGQQPGTLLQQTIPTTHEPITYAASGYKPLSDSEKQRRRIRRPNVPRLTLSKTLPRSRSITPTGCPLLSLDPKAHTSKVGPDDAYKLNARCRAQVQRSPMIIARRFRYDEKSFESFAILILWERTFSMLGPFGKDIVKHTD